MIVKPQMGRHASTSFPIHLAPRPLLPSLSGLRRLVAPVPTIGPGPHDEIVGLLSVAQRARKPLLIAQLGQPSRSSLPGRDLSFDAVR